MLFQELEKNSMANFLYGQMVNILGLQAVLRLFQVLHCVLVAQTQPR